MMSLTLSHVDEVCNYLTQTGWVHNQDMVVKGYADRPVFVRRFRKCELKCIVGSLWTTYYRLSKDVISDQDSMKTDDIESLKVALGNLVKLVGG